MAGHLRAREKPRQSRRRDPPAPRQDADLPSVRTDPPVIYSFLSLIPRAPALSPFPTPPPARFPLPSPMGGRPPQPERLRLRAGPRPRFLPLFLDSVHISRPHAHIPLPGTDPTFQDLESNNRICLPPPPPRAPRARRHIPEGSLRLRFSAVRSPGSTEAEPRSDK